MRKISKPTAIDLFSGAGGLTQGLKSAGYNVQAAIEIDPLASNTYALNHPSVKLVTADIRKTSPEEFATLSQLNSIDLIAGCPPCQEFSRIKTLNGNKKSYKRDKYLIRIFGDYIEYFYPKAVMLENVKALTKERCFSQFCKRLEAIGYTIDYKILNAADYGVPQNRERLIFIANRVGKVKFGKAAAKRKTVSDALQGIERKYSNDVLHNYKENRSDKVKRLIELIPKNGGSRKSIPKEYQLPCHQKTNGFNDVYGRMAWEKCSPTITGGCINPSRGRFLHPEKNRAITLREAALLQSFPVRYKFSLENGLYAAAQLIGNSFPPVFVKKHALQLKKELIES